MSVFVFCLYIFCLWSIFSGCLKTLIWLKSWIIDTNWSLNNFGIKMSIVFNLEWTNLNIQIKKSESNVWKCKKRLEEKINLDNAIIGRVLHLHCENAAFIPWTCGCCIYIVNTPPIGLVHINAAPIPSTDANACNYMISLYLRSVYTEISQNSCCLYQLNTVYRKHYFPFVWKIW